MEKARYIFKKQNRHNRKETNVTKDQDCDDDDLAQLANLTLLVKPIGDRSKGLLEDDGI